MAVAGHVRSGVSWSCDLPPGGDGLDKPGGDELAECGIWDADMASEPHEADAALFDGAAGEAVGGAEDLDSLSDGQEAVGGAASHAACLVAETPGASSW